MPDGLGVKEGQTDPRTVPIGSARNIANGVLLVAAAAPPIAMAWPVLTGCDRTSSAWCAFGVDHPILAMNVVFFVCITVGFWLISIVQRSTWLIDPYWTIVPPMIGHFFAMHPGAVRGGLRGSAALVLLWLWSIRLTYNYFRRERWRFGAREDWRFHDFRTRYPRHFWWMAFFVAFLSQQLMLAGLCLPLWAVFASSAAFGPVDAIAAFGCVAGVAIAHAADTQLSAFMRENEARVSAGQPKVLILERGLWRWSRHPNYFGEQLFWWSLALFGVRAGHPWVIVGAIFNTLVMMRVTTMTDRRLSEKPERAAEYAAYRARTRAWVPWPK